MIYLVEDISLKMFKVILNKSMDIVSIEEFKKMDDYTSFDVVSISSEGILYMNVTAVTDVMAKHKAERLLYAKLVA